MTSRADALLAGPRGRRLCLALVQQAAGEHGWPWLTWRDGPSGVRTGSFVVDRVRDQLAEQVAATDLTVVVQPWRLLDALLESVDQARYWQPPDDADVLLADPAVGEQLAPVAQAVAAAPAAQWWGSPLAADDQHAVAFSHDEQPPPTPAVRGLPATLGRERARAVAAEEVAARERPTDPAARYGGEWWCTPATTGSLVTSRRVLGVAEVAGRDVPAPAGLVLVEDEMGWPTARSWPVPAPPTARVREIAGPADWAALVAAHPLPVTASRRHDWYRTTGRDGAWLIPDWAAVADEVDAVHLTVDGYLATAGRAVPVPGTGAATVLAGAAPDVTWWLTDLPDLGEPTSWRRQDGDLPRWTPA